MAPDERSGSTGGRHEGGWRSAVRDCLIADRSEVFADGLESVLTSAGSGYRVVGRAVEPEEVPEAVVLSRPDIVLSGFEPVSESADVARRLHPLPVLVLSWSRRKEDVIATIRAGAVAFVLKASLRREGLLRALHNVEVGRSSFELARDARVQPDDEQRRSKLTRVHDVVLTSRELEIVSLIVACRSNREIAMELDIADQTVKNHVRNIMAKSGVTSRIQLGAWAAATGIGTPLANASRR